jgi:hypothetical protein
MRSFMRYWRGSSSIRALTFGKSSISRIRKSEIFQSDFIRRTLVHIPHGIFIVLSGHFISYHISWIFALYFISYEVIQHFIIGDGAYKDIRGALYGMVIGVIGCLIFKMN